MNKKNYEVLAPVGNYEMLDAAIKAGANAVYLGGKLFSARAFADNFSLEEIKEIVKLCHSNNIKVFITVNTLLHDYELNDAINYIIDLYNIDIDAVLVQDLGLLSLIKKYIPDLPVHASTQINIYNYYGAKLMKELGFSRVVLSRETPIEEIEYISKNVDIELEVFVHGSLCVATSGQCLMSSYIGGRSGNRGKCAQPCRREYIAYDSGKNTISKFTDYMSYLSPKDLCTIKNVNKLKELGVKSFKIEGRMKKPEYVYTVVKTYSNKLSGKDTDGKILDEVSNRGYTKGLLNHDYGKTFIEINRSKSKKGLVIGKIISEQSKRGIKFLEDTVKGDILLVETEKGKIIQLTLVDNYLKGQKLFNEYIYDSKINSEVRRASSMDIKKELANKSIDNIKKINFNFIATIDKKPVLYASYEDVKISVEHDQVVYKAINQPIGEDKIREQLSKLGNTNYELNLLNIEIDKDIFIPVKILNQMRRDAIAELDNILNTFNKRKYISNIDIEFEKLNKKNQESININLELINSYEIEENKYGDIYSNVLIEDGYYKFPRLATTKDLDKLYSKIYNSKIKGFVVNNLGDIQFLKDKNITGKIIGDIGLNILNSQSYVFLKKLGLDRLTLSTELNIEEINSIIKIIDNDFEIISYGYLTSMVMKNCPFSSIKNCIDDSKCSNCKFSKNMYLKNENNEYFLVNRYYNYSELYHSEKLNSIELIDKIDFMHGGNIRIIEFDGNLKEKLKSFNNVVNKGNKSRINENEEFTKGHFVKGID